MFMYRKGSTFHAPTRLPLRLNSKIRFSRITSHVCTQSQCGGNSLSGRIATQEDGRFFKPGVHSHIHGKHFWTYTDYIRHVYVFHFPAKQPQFPYIKSLDDDIDSFCSNFHCTFVRETTNDTNYWGGQCDRFVMTPDGDVYPTLNCAKYDEDEELCLFGVQGLFNPEKIKRIKRNNLMEQQVAMNSNNNRVRVINDKKQCYFTSVPPEILLKIFGWLDPNSKVKIEAVSKMFLSLSRQSWCDINGITISGAFLTDQMIKTDWLLEYDRILAYLDRCLRIESLKFEIGWIDDIDSGFKSYGLKMLSDYSDRFSHLTSVTGLLALCTKRAICFVLRLSSSTIKEIDLKPSFQFHKEPSFKLWGSLLLAIQDCSKIVSVSLEVPRHVFRQLLVVLENRTPHKVAIQFGASGSDDLTSHVIDLCKTTATSGHLSSLSFKYLGRRHVDAGEILLNFPSPSLETLEYLSLSVRSGPLHTWIAHLIPFHHLKVLTFSHIVWSKQAILEAVKFCFQLLDVKPSKELCCYLLSSTHISQFDGEFRKAIASFSWKQYVSVKFGCNRINIANSVVSITLD